MESKIGIALATYNPDLNFFSRQIESLRQQTFSHWTCVISDDSPSAAMHLQIRAIIEEDSRFRLLPQPESGRRGVFYNFEAALQNLPSDCDYVAFCDQDDLWVPDKLTLLVAALQTQPQKALVHSDLCLIDAQDRPLQRSCWELEHRNFEHADSLLHLVVRNRVTGCASLFRASLLQLVLPFPNGVQGEYLHDHWLAAIAQLEGGIVDFARPLVMYRQHGGNVVGAVASSSQALFWRNVSKLSQVAQKAVTALQMRQKLAMDVLARVTLQRPQLQKYAEDQLMPLTNGPSSFYLKQIACSKGKLPEFGLWLQFLWASLQEHK